MRSKQVNRYEIELSRDESTWVAQFKRGGPDVCTQGSTPVEALRRLAELFDIEAKEAGCVENIPVW